MNTVEVKKKDLFEVVQKNRSEHRAVFLKAIDAYKAEVIKVLEARLAEAKAGKRISHHIELVAPQDHTREYDRVIEMLKMSVSDTIELSATEFECYVMDRWAWATQFGATVSSYNIANKYTSGSNEVEDL